MSYDDYYRMLGAGYYSTLKFTPNAPDGPKRFYMVMVDGGNMPIVRHESLTAVRHESLTAAQKEAERLARKEGKRAYVLVATSSCEPARVDWTTL